MGVKAGPHSPVDHKMQSVPKRGGSSALAVATRLPPARKSGHADRAAVPHRGHQLVAGHRATDAIRVVLGARPRLAPIGTKEMSRTGAPELCANDRLTGRRGPQLGRAVEIRRHAAAIGTERNPQYPVCVDEGPHLRSAARLMAASKTVCLWPRSTPNSRPLHFPQGSG